MEICNGSSILFTNATKFDKMCQINRPTMVSDSNAIDTEGEMGIFGFLNKKELSQAQMQLIFRQEKILADSLKIIQTTDSLETFFARYKTADNAISEIGRVAGSDTKCIANGQASPAECMESLYKEKAAQLNNCLSRYVRKETVHIMGLSRGRMNKAKGVAAIIEEYGPDMPEESLECGRRLANQLIQKIEKLEKE